METQLISSSNESESKWRDLPQDIVLQIARRVSYTADLPRLRGVCPEWRSIIPRRRSLPSLSSRSIKLPPLSHGDNQDDLKVPLALVQSRFYLLSPLQGQGVDSTAATASSFTSTSSSTSSSGLGGRWLARMGETGRPNDEQWRLMNPFNIEDYLYIQPPISGRPLNLLDCHALELAAPLSLVRAGDTADSISDRVVGGWDFDSGHLSSVLVQLERCGRGGRLVSWKLGDAEWTSHDDLTDEGFLDIAFHDGKFYAFELSRWRVLVMDASCPCDSREFIPGPEPEGLEAEASGGDCYWLTFQERFLSVVGGCHFVAAANSRLYLVITTTPPLWSETRTPTSFVFVLKQQEGGDVEEEDGKHGSWWEQVAMDSLGDQILFIGPDVAFSVPAASVNLPQWKPNSICIFSGVLPHMYHQHKKEIGMQTECHEMITWAKLCFRVFLGDNTGVVSFQELPNEIYTALFFPPPPWLHWRCPTLQNLLIKLASDNLLCDSIEYRDLHRGLLPHLY